MVGKKMIREPHIYQKHVWDRLVKIVTSNRIGSAYLFSGPEGSAKEATAISFAAALNCQGEDVLCGTCSSCKRFSSLQHEHLHVVTPLPRVKDSVDRDTDVLTIIGKNNEKLLTDLLQEKGKDPFLKIKLPKANRILINSIRELRKKLYLKSVDKGVKTVLIFDAHYLSVGDGASANALLKILEEPPKKTTLILVTDHKALLLPTIQSRCQQIDFPPLADDLIKAYLESGGVASKESEFYAILSDGNIQRAKYLQKRSVKEILIEMKEQVEPIVNSNSTDWRKYINGMSRLVRSNSDEFKFKLFLAQTWFLQTYRLKQNLHAPLLQNGFAESVSSFSNSFPKADYAAINSCIEDTISSTDIYLYTVLKLMTMLIDIQHHLQGTN
jgi:DNA polymerase III delta prime subunit